MKYLPLSQGKQALIDDIDYPRVSQYKWTYCINKKDGHQFIVHGWAKGSGKKNLYLGRYILNAPDGLEVDHVNQNPLDNRRVNLRLATRSQNAANRKRVSNNNSGYKGVVWQPDRKKWYASITVESKQKNLGRYKTAIEAASAYNEAAIQFFGEFAVLNELA